MLKLPGRRVRRTVGHRSRLECVEALGLVAVLAVVSGGCASTAPSATRFAPGISTGTGTPRVGGAGSTRTDSGPRFSAPYLGSWTTYGGSNARTGVDATDPSLRHLRLAWDDSSSTGHGLDGAVYGQPLAYRGLVVVATENDSIYGLEAASGKVRWKVSVGAPAAESSLHSDPAMRCGDIFPLGITGTPVVDTASGEVFAAAEVQEPGTSGYRGIEHVLAAVSLATGRLVFERRIDPPGAGSAYDPVAEQQRGALSLTGGEVLVPFGGLWGDCGSYHGYLVGLPASGRGSLEVFQVSKADRAAIWATGGVFAPSPGRVFLATGNGEEAGLVAGVENDNAVIELGPGLSETAFFAPAQWHALDRSDSDLGSAAPIGVPGTGVLFQAGKPDASGRSVGYLLDSVRLGGVGGQLFEGTVCPPGAGVYGAGAVATIVDVGRSRRYLYVACTTGTEALSLVLGSRPSFAVAWAAFGPDGPPILAGGLVWSIDTGAARLSGMNPVTGAPEVSEALDPVTHFAAPSGGDGLLFVPTESGVEAFAGPSGLPRAATTALTLAVRTAHVRASSPVSAGVVTEVEVSVRPAPLGGTVTVAIRGRALPGCADLVVRPSGVARCSPAGRLAPGDRLTARYGGDAAYGASESVETVTAG